jgi:hypothetical protein
VPHRTLWLRATAILSPTTTVIGNNSLLRGMQLIPRHISILFEKLDSIGIRQALQLKPRDAKA